LIGAVTFLAGNALPPTVRADFVGASSVTTVTPVDGGFQYNYAITNTSPLGGPSLLTWALPFFNDAATSFVGGESSIFAPDGWTWLFTPVSSPTSSDWGYLAADDPKSATYAAPGTAFENPPYALVFLVDLGSISLGEPSQAIAPGAAFGGFGFISPFEGAAVPFLAGFDNLTVAIGDPVAPRTPSFPAAEAVPEAPSLGLVAAGGATLCLAAGLRRLRRRTPG
jgi:hypothetical protein